VRKGIFGSLIPWDIILFIVFCFCLSIDLIFGELKMGPVIVRNCACHMLLEVQQNQTKRKESATHHDSTMTLIDRLLHAKTKPIVSSRLAERQADLFQRFGKVILTLHKTHPLL
jgi:hypothetical protein